MRNNHGYKKHLRESSILQETEGRPGQSVLETWVRGLRSIRENPKDSLRGDKRQELTAEEHDTGSQSDDQRSHVSPPTSLWRDDGGESGEVV